MCVTVLIARGQSCDASCLHHIHIYMYSTESKYLNLLFALQYFVFCKKFWQLSHYENVWNNGWKNG